MSTAVAPHNSHELYVWDAHELLAAVSGAGREVAAGAHEAVRGGIEANEHLVKTCDTDVVALSLFVKSSVSVVKQIRLLGITGDAYIKLAKNGKKVLIFKGRPGLRPRLGGTRYLLENPKVRCFVVGTEDILKDAAKATKVAIVAFVVIDVLDEVTQDHFSLARLGVNIASHVLQAAAAAYVGAAAGVFVAAILGAPVVITFVVVVAVGAGVGLVLTSLDNRLHLTERARARMMAFEQQAKLRAAAFEKAAAARIGQAGQQVRALEHRAAADIRVAAYTVDRYFTSVEQMISHDLTGAHAR